MLLEKNNKKIFFIHIPRTSGRYITNLFFKNGFKSFELNNFNLYKGIEERHLHHTYLKEFDSYNTNKKLTVVRDPLSRFVSAATIDMYLNKDSRHNFKLETIKNVLDYIEFQQTRASFHNNWFRPQYEFISKDCKIWKLENKINNKFLNFIKKKYDINLNLHDISC